MKILIFTASAGNGHNSSANRIKEKILELDSSAEVVVSDAYQKYAPKIQQWVISKGYFLACETFTNAYNFFFEMEGKTDYSKKRIDKSFLQNQAVIAGMLKEIYDFQPDVILSTYVFCTIALNNLKMAYDIPAKIVALTLDYDVSPYWECCAFATDCMFLTDENMIKVFIEKGFNENQLAVSGIPVSEKFSMPASKQELRQELGLDNDLFTVVIMKASFFPLRESEIIKKLEKLDVKLQVIIINGNDEKAKKAIDQDVAKLNVKHRYVNIGFTDVIDKYFLASDLVFGKGGGLTTTEAVNASLPSLIIDKLPYQEKQNSNVLVENGCAVVVTRRNFAKEIEKIALDKEKYQQLVDGTNRFKKPHAVSIIANKVLSFPPAQYLNSLDDGEKEINKKVSKAYVEYLKDLKLEKKFIKAKK